eukprot:TRINITY_DN4155_c0_g4_i1.p1 TRINITY_DN4155_c0_g4~~TRINITY_DN4155_c0_g4_i1.p1  ORF type:complete len:742 (+),score=152.75 TRINITY_DN4155_c0_g4_i1:117-2228(+)
MTQLDVSMILDYSTLQVDVKKLTSIVKEYGVGSFLNTPFTGGPIKGKIGFNVTDWIAFLTQVQKIVMENSNSSTPMVYGIDSVHGANYVYGATLFPHNIGVAASWNTDLANREGQITGKDSRAAGARWIFAPVLGVGVQPLWPRFYETFGEDPYLASVMGAAFITGVQGSDMSREPNLAATAKHYLGYPAPKSGKDRTPAWIPDRMLKRYFVPPFAAAFEAGVASIMINSGEINGVPVHASSQYLSDLLRDELNFDGVAVTDWQDIEKLQFYHHIAATPAEAVEIAVNAGIDMSMVPTDLSFPQILYQLVQQEIIPESRLDESVARILNFKEQVGLYSNPYPDPKSPYIATVGSQTDRTVSLNLVQESVTLLKNERNILPLNASKPLKILVTGPGGNSLVNQCGGWTFHWLGASSNQEFPFGTTIYQGVQNIVGSNVKYVEGCTVTELTNFQEAVEAADNSDVVIVALAEAPESETVGDINDLNLPQAQIQFVNVLDQVGKPLIFVLLEARPRIFTSIEDSSDAILHAYLPGPEGGQGIADIIFGRVNPSGKLPFTYPAYTGDIGVPYYHKYSENKATSPLFKFGFGLSYTTFTYSDLKLNATNLTIGHNLQVNVTVSNDGKYSGKEVVQLYVSDVYASITPEVSMLKRFTKIHLEPRQKTTLSFVLNQNDLSFYGINNDLVIEPGLFIVQVGNLQAQFTLVE